MAIYLFSQILKFTKYSIKLIEKLSRRHLINSSYVFVIKGFTVFRFVFLVCEIKTRGATRSQSCTSNVA